MKDLLVLLTHVLTTLAKLLGLGGAKVIVGDSLLMKRNSSSNRSCIWPWIQSVDRSPSISVSRLLAKVGVTGHWIGGADVYALVNAAAEAGGRRSRPKQGGFTVDGRIFDRLSPAFCPVTAVSQICTQWPID